VAETTPENRVPSAVSRRSTVTVTSAVPWAGTVTDGSDSVKAPSGAGAPVASVTSVVSASRAAWSPSLVYVTVVVTGVVSGCGHLSKPRNAEPVARRSPSEAGTSRRPVPTW